MPAMWPWERRRGGSELAETLTLTGQLPYSDGK